MRYGWTFRYKCPACGATVYDGACENERCPAMLRKRRARIAASIMALATIAAACVASAYALRWFLHWLVAP